MLRIRILFLINTLGGGGAERVLVNLVNHMDKEKFDITVETMFADGVNKELLDKRVRTISGNKLGIKGLSRVVKYLPARFLYDYYIGKEEYDIVVAYMHGAPTKVVSACYFTNIKKVTWLHNGNPEKGSFFRFWINKDRAIQAYNGLDAIVGVSGSVSQAFSSYTGIRDKMYTLYNTNDTEKILRMAEQPCSISIPTGAPVLCAVGRLSAEKGFERLIRVAYRLHQEGFLFYILIMGDGSEKKKLQEQVKHLHAEEYVRLTGFCKNPYAVMAKSDLFVLSSYEEGLATVITEALTLGLPVVSTKVSGTLEVLGEHSEYGLTVENSEEGLYSGIRKMLTAPNLMDDYRSKAKERSRQFDTEHTVAKAEAFFEELVK